MSLLRRMMIRSAPGSPPRSSRRVVPWERNPQITGRGFALDGVVIRCKAAARSSTGTVRNFV